MKKRFKDTKVGQFLKSIGSTLGNGMDEILPDKGLLGVFKRLLVQSDTLTPQDKETALKMLEMDLIEFQEVSKRWDSDMKSDSWLSKNTRPLTLIYLTVAPKTPKPRIWEIRIYLDKLISINKTTS